MRTIKSISTLQKILYRARSQNKKIGFVPTMGALHEGHLSLIRKCRRQNDVAVLSIFVNPKQFGPREDFSKYPRDLKRDEMFAKKEKVDIIFYPSVDVVYPNGYLTYVEVETVSRILCGKFRPGHFKGVTTIVSKLLNLIQPDVLYLGQKDAQQAVIIQKMIHDLHFPVQVKICPTIREKDGLAMSSRNKYLKQQERHQALKIYRSLRLAKQEIRRGERNPKRIIQRMCRCIGKARNIKMEYIECVEARSLKPLSRLHGKVLIALAVHIGKTRLIDNVIVSVK